ncbi:hypothetical protein GCK72_007046 [Caenorhabditis remanei]|uniref:Uncharacterized protein n=1 Tax=Caenorhabditis remanei TaxID=31234 RepID=A0A6A5HGY5_CAERE|nr:hypothetical protein GCK72_007046 [Caenorhabditis remanei]KAF1767088.1 hypothetical protein GCK72_007046 [Caenorhabditis remanei]
MDNNAFTPTNVFFLFLMLYQLLVNANRRREREEFYRLLPRPAGRELGPEGPTAFTRVPTSNPDPPVLFVCEAPVGTWYPTREVPGSTAAGDSQIISQLLTYLNCLLPPPGIAVVGAEGSDGPAPGPSGSGPDTSLDGEDGNDDQPGPSRRRSEPDTRDVGTETTEEDLRLAQLMEENEKLKKENEEKDQKLKKACQGDDQLSARVDLLEKRMEKVEKENKDKEIEIMKKDMEKMKKDMESKLEEKEAENNKLKKELKKAEEEKKTAQDAINAMGEMDNEEIKKLDADLKKKTEEKNDLEAKMKEKLEEEKKKTESAKAKMEEERKKKEAAERELKEIENTENEEINKLKTALKRSEDAREKQVMMMKRILDEERRKTESAIEKMEEERKKKEAAERELKEVEKTENEEIKKLMAALEEERKKNQFLQDQLDEAHRKKVPIGTSDMKIQASVEQLDEESQADIEEVIQPVTFANYRSQPQLQLQLPRDSPVEDVTLPGEPEERTAEELMMEESGPVDPNRPEEQDTEDLEGAENTNTGIVHHVQPDNFYNYRNQFQFRSPPQASGLTPVDPVEDAALPGGSEELLAEESGPQEAPKQRRGTYRRKKTGAVEPWKPTRTESDNVRKIKQHTTPLDPNSFEFLQAFGAAQKNCQDCPLYSDEFLPDRRNLFNPQFTSQIPQKVSMKRVTAKRLFFNYRKSQKHDIKKTKEEWKQIEREEGQEFFDWCERDRMLFEEFKHQLERGFIRTRETDELGAGEEEEDEEEEEREEKKTRKRGRPRKDKNNDNEGEPDGKKSKKDEAGPSSQ